MSRGLLPVVTIDTAADAYARTGNPDAFAAAFRAADLIER